MKINGRNLRVYLNQGATNEAIAYATECDLSIDVNLPETTDKGNEGFRDLITGTTSWSVETSMLCSFSQGNINGDELTKRQLSKERVFIKIDSIGTQGNDFYYWGIAYISNLTVTSVNEDIVTMTATFEGVRTIRQIKRADLFGTDVEFISFDYSNNKIATLSFSDDRIDTYSLKGDLLNAYPTVSGGLQLLSFEGNKVAYTRNNGVSIDIHYYNLTTKEDTLIFTQAGTTSITDIKLVGDSVCWVDGNNDEIYYSTKELNQGGGIPVVGYTYAGKDDKGFYFAEADDFYFMSFSDIINNSGTISLSIPIFTGGLTTFYQALQNSTYYVALSNEAGTYHLLFRNKNTDSLYDITLSAPNTTYKILSDDNGDIILYDADNLITKYDGKTRELKGGVFSQENIQSFEIINCNDGILAVRDNNINPSIQIINNVL